MSSLYLVWSLCFAYVYHCRAAVSVEDRNVLKSLYDSTGGSTWDYPLFGNGNPWNFDSPSDPCVDNWYGVECELDRSTISGLALLDLDMHGTLPDAIGNLTSLTTFLLSLSEDLHGTLPFSVGSLTRLQGLEINRVAMTGTLPSTLCSLSALRALDISFTMHSGSVPTCMSSMLLLTKLRLRELYLTGSLLSLPPVSVTVNMRGNHLSGTLPDFPSTLTRLILTDNRFSGQLPTGVYPLLRGLSLDSNAFTGTIPSNISTSLPNITILRVDSNQLHGIIPSSLGDMKNLSSLSCSSNSLSGSLPPEIGNLINLQILVLMSNRLTGCIPSSYVSLPRLVNFYLSDNYLSCTLPDFSSVQLSDLYIGGNLISGSLPSSLVQLPLLTALDTSTNFVSGTIPPALLGHRFLQALSLSNNMMTGSFPDVFTANDSFISIDLASNHFTGTIPQSIGLLTDREGTSLVIRDGDVYGLNLLLLNDNYFTGTLPTSLGSLTSLTTVLLHNNNLHGTLHALFNNRNTSRLQVLDFSRNTFTGPLPHEMFTSSLALEAVVGSDNCLRGRIPESICAASTLESLILNGLNTNKQCKSGDWWGIRLFDYMEGSVPSCLFDTKRLPSLRVVQMSGNGLSGGLAPSLSAGSPVTELELAHNRLSGTIPAGIISNSRFSDLDLSYNRLNGGWEEDDFHINSSLKLHVNRLSGMLPLHLDKVDARAKIEVLEGNLFNCDSNHPKPSRDPSANKVACASSQLNDAIMASGVMLGCALCLAVGGWVYVSWGAGKHERQNVRVFVGNVLLWLEVEEIFRSGREFDEYFTEAEEGMVVQGNESNDDNMNGAGDNSSNESLFSRLFSKVFISPASEEIPVMSNNPIHEKTEGVEMRVFGESCENSSEKSSVPQRTSSIRRTSYLASQLKLLVEPEESGDVILTYRERVKSGAEPIDPIYRRGSIHKTASSICTETRDSSDISINRGTVWLRDDSNSASITSTTPSSAPSLGELPPMHVKSLLHHQQYSEVRMFLKVLEGIQNIAALLVLWICTVSLCLFLSLKLFGRRDQGWSQFSTHQHQYSWFPSSSFLTGTLPAVLYTCLALCAAFFLSVRVILLHTVLKQQAKTSSNTNNSSAAENIHSRSEKVDGLYSVVVSYLSMYGTILLNAAVVIAVNSLYVIIFLDNSSSTQQLFAQVCMAFFRISYSKLVVPRLIHTMSYLGGSYTSTQKTRVLLVITVFNSVVAPCLATLVSDKECMYDAFFGTSEISSSYDVTYCQRISFVSLRCEIYTTVSYSSLYAPPVIYNYMCGAAVLKNFVPVLLYTYGYVTIVGPIMYILLSQVDPAVIPVWVRKRMPWVVWPLEVRPTNSNILKPEHLLAVLFSNLAVLCTFGLCYPPLGVLVGFAISAKSMFWRIMVARYLEVQHRRCLLAFNSGDSFVVTQCTTNRRSLERRCSGVWRVPRECVFVVAFISLLFHGMMVFNISGDEVGFKDSLVYPLVLVAAGVCGRIGIAAFKGKGLLLKFYSETVTVKCARTTEL